MILTGDTLSDYYYLTGVAALILRRLLPFADFVATSFLSKLAAITSSETSSISISWETWVRVRFLLCGFCSLCYKAIRSNLTGLVAASISRGACSFSDSLGDEGYGDFGDSSRYSDMSTLAAAYVTAVCSSVTKSHSSWSVSCSSPSLSLSFLISSSDTSIYWFTYWMCRSNSLIPVCFGRLKNIVFLLNIQFKLQVSAQIQT